MFFCCHDAQQGMRIAPSSCAFLYENIYYEYKLQQSYLTAHVMLLESPLPEEFRGFRYSAQECARIRPDDALIIIGENNIRLRMIFRRDAEYRRLRLVF